MPAIRDFSYAYTTSTTGTTVVADVPATETGDLLVCVCSADTGTPTWSSAGWTQYYTQTNSTNTALLYRISTGASEPLTYTFTSTVGETLNATMISIRDVDTASPLIAFSQVNLAANNTAFPTITTTRANSLLLYISNHGSTAVAPSAIEGPVTQLWSWDGTAHSDSIAWGFAPSAGVTTSSVISSVSGTTYNGKCITVGINPPSTGATFIPAYCSADLSKLIDPLHGTTAFRGNTAFAATATTYYGTTIAGKTLGNAAVTARTDYGLNTYRSTAGLTSSLNRTWLGATSVLSAGNTITTAANKNILAHVMPLVPADLQTMEAIGLDRGIAFGMHSSANNFKIWQVHGAGTPWGINRAPIVINTGATAGVKQSTGTLNANSITGFGFFSSGFTVSSDWHWTMLWLLDTTTIAGGNSTVPVDIAGIVSAAATGHERLSVLSQGKGQLLCLQPLQFGNGGAAPINLNISTNAIEFPQQYNLASSQIYYNSVDNVAGVTFYPGANDVIDISSATFASASKFHWNWHASSALSTVLLAGCQVIGAGDVQLRSSVVFEAMSFTNCPTVTQNSAQIINCSLTGTKIISNLPSSISLNTFVFDSDVSTYGLEITVPGTYTFSGNTFSGYGANGTSTAAVYNNSGGLVTLNISGGGSTPTFTNGVGATTVVNNTISLTLTGLQPGSDVVILQAGTTTILDSVDQVAGTLYVYSYSTAQSVDIGILKAGYKPFYIRSYPLESFNASIPVAQQIDRSYA